MRSAPPYRPIDCSLHDRLEDLAVRNVRERLLIRVDDGTLQELSAGIDDLFVCEGAEHARLSDGTVVRLDRLVAIGSDRVGPAAC